MSKLLVITNINCKLTEEEFNGTKFFPHDFSENKVIDQQAQFSAHHKLQFFNYYRHCNSQVFHPNF